MFLSSLYALIRRFTNDDDVAQESAICAMRGCDKGAEPSRALVRTIVRSRATDRKRAAGRRRTYAEAELYGLSPAVGAAWRKRTEMQLHPERYRDECGGIPPAPLYDEDIRRMQDPKPSGPEFPYDVIARITIEKNLPAFPLRERIAAAMVVGIDPEPWLPELAAQRGVALVELRRRVQAAMYRVGDRGLAAAVFYSAEPSRHELDAYRQLVRRFTARIDDLLED